MISRASEDSGSSSSRSVALSSAGPNARAREGRLDRAARDLRVAILARQPMEDRERALHVAALRGDLGHQEFVDRIGRRGGVLPDDILVIRLVVGEHGIRHRQCNCRSHAYPPIPRRHSLRSHERLEDGALQPS
jgi:hypothetical protein